MNLDKEKIMRSVDEIHTREPFNNLYRDFIDPDLEQRILDHMLEYGYDHSFPIILWKQEDVIVDGHTRLSAAIKADMTEVPVIELDFSNEWEAIKYAFHNQKDRRNRTSAELAHAFKVIEDRLKEQGRDPNTGRITGAPSGAPGKSAKDTADLLGTSRSTVERLRTIDRFAPDDLKQDLTDGKKSIRKVYDELQEQRKQEEVRVTLPPKPPKPMFNKTTIQEPCDLCGHTIKDSIEWAYYTWNPATGCHHGCPYCYARDIANRFYTDYPLAERFDYHFHPERIACIKNTPIPKNDIVGEHNVFVCSMADLFGDWVKQEDIDKVFSTIEEAPDWWNFLFLTKNPKRYLELDFPEKSWLGATADTQDRADKTMEVFAELRKQENCPILFLSMEPLLERIILPENPPCDWLIIGGRSGNSNGPAMQPNWEWVESILQQFPIIDFDTKQRKNNMKIYFKPNCETRPREYPSID